MELRLDDLRAFGSTYVANFPDDKKHPHGFSKWEMHVHVHFSKEGEISTTFRVYPKVFADWNECLYECKSFTELKTWLEEHSDEIE